MKILNQTLKNHLKVLPTMAITTALYFLMLWYFKFDKDILVIALVFYTLTVVPSFFLHVTYFLNDKNKVCTVYADRIIIGQKLTTIELSVEEIKEIIIYKSASIEQNGFPITAMEEYFFVRIYDSKNNVYNLTCLLNNKIDKTIKQLKGVKIYTERGFYNNLGKN